MSVPPRRPAVFPLQLQNIGPAAKGKPLVTGGSAAAVAVRSVVQRTVLRPQAMLHQAASDARHRQVPSGLGLDSIDVRRRMVQRLRAQGVRHEGLLAAFDAVPRHAFVDPALVTQAYEDTSLPIGHGQTISKPSVVALMIELLLQGVNASGKGHLGRVLEIGSGCGYQAALLCRMATNVVSIERIRALYDKACELTAALRMDTLRLVYGDGMHGHPPRAPYDCIIAAASAEVLPPAWLDQLAVGGRLVCPVVAAPRATAAPSARQVLVVIDRHEHGFTRQLHEAVQFVPLKSGSV